MIVAQSALEVLTAQVIDEVARTKGLDWVNHPRLIGRTYELTDERLQRVYAGLTEDRIQEHSKWAQYVELVKKRHLVVHEGREVSATEAEDFLVCIEELMTHLEGVGSGQ